MKRFILVSLALFFAFCSSAFAQLPPYGIYVMQADVSGTFFWGRYFTPSTPTDSYMMMYNGSTQQPILATLGSSLTWNGATLDIGSITQSQVSGLTSSLAGKFNVPTGTTAQYVRGDGSLATLPTVAARSFNYTTRTLDSCFQVSSTRDANVSYAVEVSASLSLSGGTQGTAYLEIFTNSGCTTGTQEVTRFTNGNSGTLTIGLGLTQVISGQLSGIIPAGAWAKIRTQNNTGTPTFTSRPGQEVLL